MEDKVDAAPLTYIEKKLKDLLLVDWSALGFCIVPRKFFFYQGFFFVGVRLIAIHPSKMYSGAQCWIVDWGLLLLPGLWYHDTPRPGGYPHSSAKTAEYHTLCMPFEL